MTTPYDTIPYRTDPQIQTHPDRMACVARLFGLDPRPITECRVLEIGCSDGHNLIPMALTLPGSRFVGIDLAQQPIDRGLALLGALGLDNIELRQFDLIDVGPEFGEFDYIIAHGVYSWVPDAVRDKVLAICRANLAPSGVAYVSYNAYPGCHFRQISRGMARYYLQGVDSGADPVEQGVAFLHFLADSAKEATPWKQYLSDETVRIEKIEAYHVRHDDFGEINQPVYFHEFVDHAFRYDLEYLGDAHFVTAAADEDVAQPLEIIQQLTRSRVTREQFIDFVTCRAFRQSLVCHAGRDLGTPEAGQLEGLWASAQLTIDSDGGMMRFTSPGGSFIKTDDQPLIATLRLLGERWPQAASFEELAEAAGERDTPAGFLLKSYPAKFVDFHTRPLPLVTAVSERPVASPLARLQAETGRHLTTLRHKSVPLSDAVSRKLLCLLDGTRDRAALLGDLSASILAGGVKLEADGASVTDPARVLDILDAGLDRNLTDFARLGLLSG